MAIPDTIKLSMYEAWTEEMKEHQRRILLARAYHDGNQPLTLTDRQKKFLALHSDSRFCLNVCRLVVTTLCDQLSVIGFDTRENKNDSGKKPFAEWMWTIWKNNKMDMFQSEVHEWTARDGEGFIILDWDEELKYPVIVLHEAWTSEDVSAWEYSDAGVTTDMVDESQGNGAGVYVKYKNDDIMQPMEYAIQYFFSEMIDEKGDAVQIHRRTVYYPDRIIREFMGDNGKWMEFEPEQSWKRKDGKPLGIPVVPFINKDMRPEAQDAFSPQDAINKTYADILASADFFGFPSVWLYGTYPTTDGKEPAADNSNVLYFQPGQINGNANKLPGDVSVTKWEGSDPTPLMDTLKDQIMFIAQITETPVTKFITSAQVASAETQKEQKDGLKKKAQNRQTSWGDSWESVMSIARVLENEFGANNFDETISIETIWKNLDTIDDLKEEQALGVPLETLWGRLGYSAQKIAEMKASPAYRVPFMKAFWETYNLASASNITVENFARMVGMTEDEIKLLSPSEIVPTAL